MVDAVGLGVVADAVLTTVGTVAVLGSDASAVVAAVLLHGSVAAVVQGAAAVLADSEGVVAGTMKNFAAAPGVGDESAELSAAVAVLQVVETVELSVAVAVFVTVAQWVVQTKRDGAWAAKI